MCSRSPRRVASALTTRLPLWDTSATWPGCRRRQRVAPQRRARVERDQPVAVRPADRQRVPPPRPPLSASSSAAPAGVSPNPARVHHGAAAPDRARLLDDRRHARRRDRDHHRVRRPRQLGQRRKARHARATDERRGLTPQTSPSKPSRRRLSSVSRRVRLRPLAGADHDRRSTAGCRQRGRSR